MELEDWVSKRNRLNIEIIRFSNSDFQGALLLFFPCGPSHIGVSWH